jgi:hypothetical protein
MSDENRIEKPWGYLVMTEDGPVPVIKRRRLYVVDEEFSLSPDSLVGSAFLVVADGQMVWSGVVVGEPQAGKYLCELERLEEGASNVQRLFTLDTLMGLGDEGRRLIEGAIGESKAPVIDPSIEWRLYDSEAEMKEAYIAWSSAKQVAELKKEVE